jgi:hypothetical protein
MGVYIPLLPHFDIPPRLDAPPVLNRASDRKQHRTVDTPQTHRHAWQFHHIWTRWLLSKSTEIFVAEMVLRDAIVEILL